MVAGNKNSCFINFIMPLKFPKFPHSRHQGIKLCFHDTIVMVLMRLLKNFGYS